jgi:hypothetical protein
MVHSHHRNHCTQKTVKCPTPISARATKVAAHHRATRPTRLASPYRLLLCRSSLLWPWCHSCLWYLHVEQGKLNWQSKPCIEDNGYWIPQPLHCFGSPKDKASCWSSRGGDETHPVPLWRSSVDCCYPSKVSRKTSLLHYSASIVQRAVFVVQCACRQPPNSAVSLCCCSHNIK